MTKKLVFISHITSEKEIALAFKELVKGAFLGMIDVFVSSDPESLTLGKRWLEEITDALGRCDVEIVFTSPASIRRPWINFETGAGYIRGIPVIPICHSGMTPDNCFPILNSLQGGTATNQQELKNVFALLAKTLDCEKPEVDFSAFTDLVKSFESISEQMIHVEEKVLTPASEGLRDYELATLLAAGNVAPSPHAAIEVLSIKERMGEALYAPIATTLGLQGLGRHGFVETFSSSQGYDNETEYCRITSPGWQYLAENPQLVELKVPPPVPRQQASNELPF